MPRALPVSTHLPVRASLWPSVAATARSGAMHWLWLTLAIAAETIGTTALKASDGFTRLWPSLVATTCFLIALVLLSQVLRVIPVGVTYAIWSGLGIVLISLIARFAFGQTLDLAAVAGISLIVAGILVIQMFSNTTGH